MGNDEQKMSTTDKASETAEQKSVAKPHPIKNMSGFFINDTNAEKEVSVIVKENDKLQDEYTNKYFIGLDTPMPELDTESLQAPDSIAENITNIALCYDGKKNEGIRQRIIELSNRISELKKESENTTQHAKVAIYLKHSDKFSKLSAHIITMLQAAVNNLNLQDEQDAAVLNNIASIRILTEQQEIKVSNLDTFIQEAQNAAQENLANNLNIPVTTALNKTFQYILDQLLEQKAGRISEDQCAALEDIKNNLQNANPNDKRELKLKINNIRDKVGSELWKIFLEIYKAQEDSEEVNSTKRENIAEKYFWHNEDDAKNRSITMLSDQQFEILESLAFAAQNHLLHPLKDSNKSEVLEALTYADGITIPASEAPEFNAAIAPDELKALGGATSYMNKFDEVLNNIAYQDNALQLHVAAGYCNLFSDEKLYKKDNNGTRESTDIEKLVIHKLLALTGNYTPEEKIQKTQKELLLNGPNSHAIKRIIKDLRLLHDSLGDNEEKTVDALFNALSADMKTKTLKCDINWMNTQANPLPIFIKTENLSEATKKLLIPAGSLKEISELVQFSTPFANISPNQKIKQKNKSALDDAVKEVVQYNNQTLEKANAILQTYHNTTGIKADAPEICKQQEGSFVDDQQTPCGKKLVYGLTQKAKNPLLHLDSNLKQSKEDEQETYVASHVNTGILAGKIFTHNPQDQHLIYNIQNARKLLENDNYTLYERTTSTAEENLPGKEIEAKMEDLETDPSKMLNMVHNTFNLLKNENDPTEFPYFEIQQRTEQSSDKKNFVVKPAYGLSQTMKALWGENFDIRQEKNSALVLTKKQKRAIGDEKKVVANNPTASRIESILTEQTQDNTPKVEVFELVQLTAEAAYISTAANKTLAIAIAPILCKIDNSLQEENSNLNTKIIRSNLEKILQNHITNDFDEKTQIWTCAVDLKDTLNKGDFAGLKKDELKKNIKDLETILRKNKSDKGVTITLNEDSTKIIVTQAKPPKQSHAITNNDKEEREQEAGVQAFSINKLEDAYRSTIAYLQASGNAAQKGNSIIAKLEGNAVAKLCETIQDPINRYIDNKYAEMKTAAKKNAKLLETVKKEADKPVENKKQEETPDNIQPKIKEAVKSLSVTADKEIEEEAQKIIQNAYKAIEKLPEKCIIKLKEKPVEETGKKDEETIAKDKLQRKTINSIFAAIVENASKKIAEKEAKETTGFFANTKRLFKGSVNKLWSAVAAPILYTTPLKVKDILFGAPDKGTELQRAINKTCLLRSTNNVEFTVTGFAALLFGQQPSDENKTQPDNKLDALLKKFENVKFDETNTNAALAAILSGDTSSIEIVAQDDKEIVSPAKVPTVEKQQSAPNTKTEIANVVAANADVAKQASVALA